MLNFASFDVAGTEFGRLEPDHNPESFDDTAAERQREQHDA